MSSGRDLVEEFLSCGLWPLSHGWDVGATEMWSMPFKENVLVRSPTFTIELHGRDVGAFINEVEAEVVKLVGKYSMNIEMPKS